MMFLLGFIGLILLLKEMFSLILCDIFSLGSLVGMLLIESVVGLLLLCEG